MKVLAINGGSSSLRWGLYDLATERTLEVGAIEEVRDADAAWREARPQLARLAPDAVGHRVVHGGDRFTEATPIDRAVVAAIEAQVPLAPVHNPRGLLGIREAQALFPDVTHVAVFDTAFHQTLAPEAYRYALPRESYERDGVRRFGFHGTSHRYASGRAAELLGIPADAFSGVTVHLGNGCSIAAIANGRSVDTSMGMTPLEGLMMGTRSGDVDPAVVLDLVAREGGAPERVLALLNEQSGLLGVSGVSSDLREIESAADAGDSNARLAGEMFAHRAKRGVGAALGVVGGADAIVLTGGIGEHAAAMREQILGHMQGLGVELDANANCACVGREGRISTPGSRVAVLVVPAREEWLIARETGAVLG